MRITEVNPEAVDLTEAKILVNFSEVKICVVEVNAIKTCTKANIRVIAINNNYQYHQYYGHDDEYQTDQYGPPCALCSGYNHSPKHCFKGEHDINDIMEKMNISGHQSQSSGLYS